MLDLQGRLDEAKGLAAHGRYQDACDKFSMLIDRVALKSVREIIIPESQNQALVADIFNHRGIAKRMLGQYDEALKDYNLAWAASESDEQKAFAHINIADIERVAQSDFPAAHCSLDEALTFCENGSLMHAKAVDQRGLVFVGQEDYPSAIAAYKTARRICEALIFDHASAEIENRFGQVIHHLGAAYVALNDPEKVDEAYDSQITALDIFTRLGDQQGVVNAVRTIGMIAAIKEDYTEAIAQYERALNVLDETKYDRAIVAVSLDLAEAHLRNGEPEKAEPYLARFSDGVLNEEITDHDTQLMKDQFNNVLGLYGQIDEQVKAKFE
ncbi:tetratricopeptide repeat protein [Candidatus Woesearchaeota archaeon]|nr:tetratricopeptide repeat protein [Candidatus Woesearchaeota archaeon]